jgi:alkylation response protein AidB-like acyl-CoA dehydrogenase
MGAVCHQDGINVAEGTATGHLPWVPRPALDWLVLVGDAGIVLIENPPHAALENRACGLHACGGVEVTLDATPCQMIGSPEAATTALAECRILAATVMIGAARDAHAAAARYAQERIAFGKPIAHHQGLAFQLADAATDLEAAQLLIDATAGHPTLVASAHAYADEVAHRVCERSVQALGGHGYLYDHRVEKRMRDVRAVAALYGGSIRSEHDAASGILNLSDPLELS